MAVVEGSFLFTDDCSKDSVKDNMSTSVKCAPSDSNTLNPVEQEQSCDSGLPIASSFNEENCKETNDPYSYLNRGDFTTELYKLELMNLPKQFGIAVSNS
jgi:hypothetical protein